MDDTGKDIIDRQNGFIKLSYLIDQSGGWDSHEPKLVHGHAFETPGFPGFHACVRWDRDWQWSAERWIVDHYESGLHINEVGKLEAKEEAPAALAQLLMKKGPELVAKTIALYSPCATGTLQSTEERHG